MGLYSGLLLVNKLPSSVKRTPSALAFLARPLSGSSAAQPRSQAFLPSASQHRRQNQSQNQSQNQNHDLENDKPLRDTNLFF
jgi:hypothetical protein